MQIFIFRIITPINRTLHKCMRTNVYLYIWIWIVTSMGDYSLRSCPLISDVHLIWSSTCGLWHQPAATSICLRFNSQILDTTLKIYQFGHAYHDLRLQAPICKRSAISRCGSYNFLFVLQHPLEGYCDPLNFICTHRKNGATPWLYFPAPTERRWWSPFPCHIRPPWYEMWLYGK